MSSEQTVITQRNRRCSKCKAIMDYLALGEYRCPECGNEELDSYGVIRKYIDKHGPTPSALISLETGVPMNVIDDFLRKGRLEISDTSSMFLHCEKCGKDIKFGRICAACAKNSVTKMKEAFAPEEIGDEPVPISELQGRMFSTDRLKRRRDSI